MSNVLSIAGFDPSGGAGLLADIKTFNHFGVNGFGVATSVTYQCEDKFYGAKWLTFDEIRNQLDPLYERYNINVVKIGLIHDLEILRELISYIRFRNESSFIIWDPILSSSSGFVFHEGINNNDLSVILSNVNCITPNLVENERLLNWLGKDKNGFLPTDIVVIKGGHDNRNEVEDKLYLQGELIDRVTRTRIEKNIHGSGCIFSSALAANYSKNDSLVGSFRIANKYVYKLIRKSNSRLAQHHLIKS